jgi:hypothetical protein
LDGIFDKEYNECKNISEEDVKKRAARMTSAALLIGMNQKLHSIPRNVYRFVLLRMTSNRDDFGFVWFESNTVHKNRLICLSSDFSLHCSSSKGKNWINWGWKLVLLIENSLILVRPNTQVLGLRDEG